VSEKKVIRRIFHPSKEKLTWGWRKVLNAFFCHALYTPRPSDPP
jgi:hypothetical protein